MDPTLAKFGAFLHPDQKVRILKWLDRLAPTADLESASTAVPTSIAVYTDYLNWIRHSASRWLRKLDRLEARYRTTGLSYHSLPYASRHPPTVPPPGNNINRYVLGRLSQILETDRFRSQQSFFQPWVEIQRVAVEIIKEINSIGDEGLKNEAYLKATTARLELKLHQLQKPLRNLKAGLEWLEDTVEVLSENQTVDASECLVKKHSREGGAFRRWIQTFPEVEFGIVGEGYVELYAGRLLANGVEPGGYWSELVDLEAGLRMG